VAIWNAPLPSSGRVGTPGGELKHRLKKRAPKTGNNGLTVLKVLLKKAVEWDVSERMPCVIRLLPIPKPSAGFYDFDEYERLAAAASADRTACLIVLLGGDAGLRCGEMMALEWRETAIRTADGSARKSALRASTSAWPSCSVSARRVTAHAEDRAGPRPTISATCAAYEERGPSATPHVLFAPGDAWGTGQSVEPVKWWRRRESNPRPRVHRRGRLHA
jgi:hypothetical protein